MTHKRITTLLLYGIAVALVAGACNERNDRTKSEAYKTAKALKSHVYCVKEPFYILVRDQQAPSAECHFFNTSSSIGFSDESTKDDLYGRHREASVALGTALSVHLCYSKSGRGKLHELSVATNDCGFIDWLADGSYDLKVEFEPGKTFIRFGGKWVEVVDGTSYYRRQVKGTNQWMRFDLDAGRWKEEPVTGPMQERRKESELSGDN